MTSTTNPSALLADFLAQFTNSATIFFKQQFTEIENQRRIELLHAVSETREAREETREVRAELARAGLTIAHQAENIESQLETIAELRREVNQWKDQSRNWQEHFLRVEQERCAQSSRIDELVKLQFQQYTRPTLLTPKQKYATVLHQHPIHSAPSSMTTKGINISSPTQPPSYKSAVPLGASDTGSCSDTSPPPAKSNQVNQGVTLKQRREYIPGPSEDAPQTSITVRPQNSSSSKRKPKGNDANTATATSSQRQDPAVSHTTVIRRVQAVFNVKREESDDDSVEDRSAITAKDEASDEEETVGTNQRRSSRRSRKIVKDDEDIEQNYLASDGNPVCESRPLRHRNAAINYQEDDDDDDELMMGAEENHEEVYGTQRVETLDAQRLKQQPYPTSSVAPPKKKRKVAAR